MSSHGADSVLRTLRRNVLATPEDTAQRLVYADALAESGATDEAAVIVASHALDLAREAGSSGDNDLHKRYLACLRTAHDLWSKRLGRFGVTEIELRNGLVDSIAIPAKKLVQFIDALFAVAPIRELRIRGLEELRTRELASLLASPHLQRLRALAIPGATMNLGRIEALFGEKSIARRVASLDLSNTQWDTLTTNNLRQYAGPCAATKIVLSGTRGRDVGEWGSGAQRRPVCSALLAIFPEARHVVIHASAPTLNEAIPAIRPRKLERLDLAIPRSPAGQSVNTRTSLPAEMCGRFCAEKASNLIELRLNGFWGIERFVMDSLSNAPFRRALRVLHLGERGGWKTEERDRLGVIVREATELEELALEGVEIGGELASFFTSSAPRALSLTSTSLTEASIDALVNHTNPRVLRSVSIVQDRVLTPSVREKLTARFGTGFSYEL